MSALRVGDHIPFDGETCEVVRISPCAAYIRRERTHVVSVTDPNTGDVRTFEAHDSSLVAISLHSGRIA